MLKEEAHILIVDDTEPVRNFVVSCLEAVYDCTAVVSAEDAIDLLKKEDFQLVVTDISMSGMSGIELSRYIFSNCQNTAVIIMSAIPKNEVLTYESSLKPIGASGFLAKPFRPEELLAMVHKALASSGA